MSSLCGVDQPDYNALLARLRWHTEASGVPQRLHALVDFENKRGQEFEVAIDPGQVATGAQFGDVVDENAVALGGAVDFDEFDAEAASELLVDVSPGAVADAQSD